MEAFHKNLLRPVCFEVDLDALRHNFQETLKLIGKNVKIIPALKCNANGFGCLEVAHEVLSMGAYGVAVADLFEAINLRKGGVKSPILLYANNFPTMVAEIIQYDLIPTITDFDSAKFYSENSIFSINVYVKVDVGLNRIGVLPDLAASLVQKLYGLKNINISGIYTHLHYSSNSQYVKWQIDKFKKILDDLESKHIKIPIKMAAATPFVLQHPDTYLNTVDPGRLILGNPVIGQPKQKITLKPLFKSLKTRIIERKIIKPPTKFTKEAVFPVKRDTVLGVIPIGWGDGYPRQHSSIGPVLVHGKRVPVLGNVHFEHTRIDLTDVPEAKIGDEVVLIGKQKDEEITLDEIVKIRGTDLQEVHLSIRSHVPVLYWKNGRPYKLKTPLGVTMF